MPLHIHALRKGTCRLAHKIPHLQSGKNLKQGLGSSDWGRIASKKEFLFKGSIPSQIQK